MNERLVNVSILVGTLVVAIAVGEIAVRKFGRVSMQPTRDATDSLVTYRLKPNTKGRARFPGVYDYTWTTNSQQLRANREYPQAKPPGIKRVVAIGDSFTFGMGVNDHEAYPAVLDSLLNAACADSVEVMNFGVSGYSLSQEVETYEQYARPFQPDAVVYAFVPNDVADNLQFAIHKLVGDSAVAKPLGERPQLVTAKRITEMIPGYNWLITHSALVNGARQAFFMLNRRQTAGGPEWVDNRAAWRVKPDLNSADWRLQRALLKRLHSSVTRDGAGFVAILFADDSATHAYYQGQPEIAAFPTGMRQVCQELAVRCVDFPEWLVQNAPRARLDTLFITGDGHHTRQGQWLAAKAVAGPVSELLGCPAEPSGSVPPRAGGAPAGATRS